MVTDRPRGPWREEKGGGRAQSRVMTQGGMGGGGKGGQSPRECRILGAKLMRHLPILNPPIPQLTCFQVHHPWAGIAYRPLPLPLGPPSAHPAISPGHPAALCCGVSPPGKASAPPADVMSPCDTLGETLGRCPLCATVNRFTSIPLDSSHQHLPRVRAA